MAATTSSTDLNKLPATTINHAEQDATSTEYGFKWKIIPLAIGVIAAITLIAVSILLTQNLQLYLGATLLVATSVGLYLACTENTELGDLDQKLINKRQELGSATQLHKEKLHELEETEKLNTRIKSAHENALEENFRLKSDVKVYQKALEFLQANQPDAYKKIKDTLRDIKKTKNKTTSFTEDADNKSQNDVKSKQEKNSKSSKAAHSGDVGNSNKSNKNAEKSTPADGSAASKSNDDSKIVADNNNSS